MSIYAAWKLNSDDTDEPEAITLVRDVTLEQLATRRCSANREGLNFQNDDKDLEAFPAKLDETVDLRRKRLNAYWSCWEGVKCGAEDCIAQSHRPVFESLAQFVGRCLELAREQGDRRWQEELLPMGLVFAGGLNSADHKHTFQDLSAYLRSKGSHVARLDPILSNAASPSVALGQVLQQVAHLQGAASGDAEGLMAWYRDLKAGAPAAERSAVVVVLEELEAWQPRLLGDLLILLSESRQEVPVVVLAHMSTSMASLQAMVPPDAACRLECETFKLPTALDRFELIVRDVLLSGKHGILLHSSTCDAIDTYFQSHDFTTASLMRALQATLLCHFMSEPLSMLIAPAVEGRSALKETIEKVSGEELPRLLGHFRSMLCPGTASDLPREELVAALVAAVGAARDAHVGWSVSLRWLSGAARTLAQMEPQAFGAGFGLKDLFRIASFPSYFSAESGDGPNLLKKVLSSLMGLGATEASDLLRLWLEDVSQVEGGENALGEIASEARQLREQVDSGFFADGRPSSPGRPSLTEGPEAISRRTPGRGRKSLEAAVVAFADEQERRRTLGAENTLGYRLSQLLKTALNRFLVQHPASYPGSVVFRCRQDHGKTPLFGAPRDAFHMAMDPCAYLTKAVNTSGWDSSVSFHDTCTAYQLSLQHGEFVNIAEWFSEFSSAVKEGIPVQRAQRKKRRTKKHTPDKEMNFESDGLAIQADRELLELPARFTQALAELQLMGYTRSTRRNRLDAVQRLIFPYVSE
uniref:Origin recognition complex subunit 3 n=1 Tax=Tetraselmis sp. GSL018 TaxID=582737 RepID=A0A061R7C0_9CHLO